MVSRQAIRPPTISIVGARFSSIRTSSHGFLTFQCGQHPCSQVSKFTEAVGLRHDRWLPCFSLTLSSGIRCPGLWRPIPFHLYVLQGSVLSKGFGEN